MTGLLACVDDETVQVLGIAVVFLLALVAGAYVGRGR